MDTIGTNALRSLLGTKTGPCVSIYLPTHMAGAEGQHDPVRLKNLLQEAENELVKSWMSAPAARKLLAAARKLPDNGAIWDNRNQGLAVFVAPYIFQPYRLPAAFDELVIVGRRFHIKPLLPLLSDGDRFLILALSQNKVRLFNATRHLIETVAVPGLPVSMEDALNYTAVDRGSQVHSAMHGGLGKQSAVFHGQGGQADTRKEDLAQFFRQVDSALRRVLRDESAPLLLAGVEYLLPIYRDVASYSHIIDEELTGNCDHLSAHQIQQSAWLLVEPLFQQSREAAVAKYRQLAGTGKTSADIREIVPAAYAGKIETLFVDVHALQWGSYNPQTTTVELHEASKAGDSELLDEAAVQTLSTRGTVYSVEHDLVPSGNCAAAVFRY